MRDGERNWLIVLMVVASVAQYSRLWWHGCPVVAVIVAAFGVLCAFAIFLRAKP